MNNLFNLKFSAFLMIATLAITIWSGCEKDLMKAPATAKGLTFILPADTCFITMVDSTDTARVFRIYNQCSTLIGSIKPNVIGKIKFNGQTSTTVTITGSTSITLTKGQNYYFKPLNCSSGNYILGVKFNTGIQPICNYFNFNNCAWSAVGSCGIVNTYGFRSTLPIPCE